MSPDIEIEVRCPSGTGQSAIIQIIAEALRDKGLDAQVLSYVPTRTLSQLHNVVDVLRQANVRINVQGRQMPRPTLAVITQQCRVLAESMAHNKALDCAAAKLYAQWTDSQDIHSNRFPIWSELGQARKQSFRDQVTAEQIQQEIQ